MSAVISSAVQTAIGEADPRLRAGLQWFADHRGEYTRWPQADGGLLLATKARGIYKPEGVDMALSVRETIASPYADRPPRRGPDGTWRYLYHQQGSDTSRPDSQWDDKALNRCRLAQAVVGVLRQVETESGPQYLIEGLARVIDWFDGYFVLEGIASGYSVRSEVVSLDVSNLDDTLAEESAATGEAIPISRDAVHRDIARRRGQPAFRKRLLQAYRYQCSVTGCGTVQVLEAAHIATYPAADDNRTTNGLVLRADVHTLFDLGLLSVHDRDNTVLLSPELAGTEYEVLHGEVIGLPNHATDCPDRAALRRHRAWAGL